MLLTYKIKHNRNFSEELQKARKVAEFCIKHQSHNRGLNSPPIQKLGSSFPFLPFSSFSTFSEFSQDFPIVSSAPSSLYYFSAPNSFPVSGFLSPGDVKHIGLKSVISGQILKKYSRNQDFKSVKNVKLIIPSRAISVDRKEQTLRIPCLKLLLNYHFSSNFKKISQIEIDSIYAYIAVVFPDDEVRNSEHYIGVDRNTKGHIAVVADPESGKIWKLGKMRYHTHKKYENIKKRLYSRGRNKQLKAVEVREKNIVKDLNHKISRKIVDVALYNGCGIKLENLKGIRKLNKKIEYKGKGEKSKSKSKNKKRERNRDKNRSEEINKNFLKNKSASQNQSWSGEYSLNSWSFQQLQQFIEYKARLQGVEVAYIDPHATSKKCSRCGHIGNRHSKQFECPHCGHVDHADVNAAFNIALTPKGSGQFSAERDAGKGSTDTPRRVLDRTIFSKRTARKKTSPQFAWEVCQFLN
jgi:transposase, IS605 OrfB family, central region